MSLELLDKFVAEEVVIESDLEVEPDVFAECITGEEGTV